MLNDLVVFALDLIKSIIDCNIKYWQIINAFKVMETLSMLII